MVTARFPLPRFILTDRTPDGANFGDDTKTA